MLLRLSAEQGPESGFPLSPLSVVILSQPSSWAGNGIIAVNKPIMGAEVYTSVASCPG